MNVDYFIVGCGLAGIAFCEQLRQHDKSFLVFDNGSQQSSKVAAGLYNPVILKRFSEVWMAREQLELALPKYKAVGELLKTQVDYPIPILRRFASIEEQNLWFSALDKPALEPFLSISLVKNDNEVINAPFGFGEVLHTGRVDTTALIDGYQDYLTKEGRLVSEAFNHELFNVESSTFYYGEYTADRIVFCEGFGIKRNPYFQHLPLNGTKGETITIKAPNLKLDVILKGSAFLLPLGDDLYTVGATYNWTDKTNQPSKEGCEELVNKVKELINCDFTVIDQEAGIRPTVKDRRPLVGEHPEQPNMYILNGLGTRGVMIAPYVAEQLYEHIENNQPLNPEIDIKRFSS
ncbi:FAD-binding oxidoreductase [Mangrovimonas sp. DI 80]|uniref:NAD(P)/FAD-dependent oxidoreductase n=1 Tax=Mangrovimonas sp. DI 80 TaxID=1779330 RepID=UPI0009788455|nr:FAD-binding oxidoreductase [Mangrovimonas sp. DI 80]OMP32656.1 FAD-dependent oxidoreductase [Mangrovimonas sp. DI 80]